MTTETRSGRHAGSARVLLRSAAVACLVGLGLAALGGLTSGSAAAYGALFGAGVTVLVLFGGSLLVDLVASILPSASMLIALLTYALQLVLLAVILLGVERSAGLSELFARPWLGAGIIAVTAAWVLSQIVVSTRRRMPAFD